MDKPVIGGMGELLWDMLPTGRQCGGAPANVVYHINQLGLPAYMISSVGNDADGDDLLAWLRSKGIDCRFITRNSLPTGLVTVTLENGIPSYEIHKPSAWDAIAVTPELLDACRTFSAFVFGSLSQRCKESETAIRRVLDALPKDCLKVFDINLRQAFFTREIIEASLAASDVLKLNDEECAVIADMLSLKDPQEEIVAALAEKFNLKYVILTLGANGSALYTPGAKMAFYPVADCPKVVDTVGCGDSFLAAWLVSILSGKTPDDAMKRASEISAFVAGQKGGMPNYR
ncbi:MAG: carbohydrate kinase [Victivallales bacterium]|nr:carbohydrate kinase [Victivallales bacterium]